MSTLPPPLDVLGPEATHRDAEQLLRAQGWRPCGAGDWAVALALPDGDVVARISPFDPVGPYTARLYREAAATGRVPRLLGHRALAGGGDLQLLERLEPVPEDEAAAFHRRLAAADAELAPLAEIVARIHEEARRALPWCGPLDANPANVMRTRAGTLVLIDPYYADGPELYATARTAPDLLAARIPAAQRRWMTEIPLASSGPWPPEEREQMRRALAAVDARTYPRQDPDEEAAMTPTPTPRGSVAETAHGRELRIARTFTADIETVWAALTTSEGLEPWIGRLEGDPATGTVTFYMTAEGEDVPGEECTIRECTPPRSFAVDTSMGEDSWHLRVELTEEAGATQLLFAQVLGKEPAGSVGPGWEYYLDRLGRSLEGGDVAGVSWEDYYPAMKDHYDALAR